jgi:hypothetical protein
MKKSLIFSFAALMFVILTPIKVLAADTNESSQTVSMTVNGSNMIKVMNASEAGPNPGTTTVSLTLSGASEAGAAISPVAADSSTRLRMSCLTVGSETRLIKAQIQTGGGDFTGKQSRLQLALKTPTNTTNFTNYTTNASTGINTFITLGDNDGNKIAAQSLITGIKTSWTGTTAGDGYVIYYKYSAYEGQAPSAVANVSVLFTISATL